MTEENKNFSLPKLILVQPLNTAQDEVSDNLQNTDTFGDIEVIDKQPVDDIEPIADNNESHVLGPIPTPLPLCLNNNRFNI
jgi:hypothetical protein